MAVIVQKENPVLRSLAREVNKEEIKSAKVQNVIKEMKEAIASELDAVAIAAPQVGVPLRIFVVSGRAIDISNRKKKRITTAEKIGEEKDEEKKEKGQKTPKSPDLVFINPLIVRSSKNTMTVEEGCLSVRYLYGKVKRFAKTTVSALDENGKIIQRGGSGLLSQIFQHETDHLNGVLFTDKATDVKELPAEEIEKIKKWKTKT